MKQILFLVLNIIVLSSFAFSQISEEKKVEKEITICPIKLLAKTANFRFSYRYIVKTDEKGVVSKVEQLGKDDFPKFIKDEEFIACIENWRLGPSDNYYVVFVLGTSTYLGKNYISISSKKEEIKINLGIIGEELIVEEKQKKQ